MFERTNSSQKYYDVIFHALGTRSIKHVSIEHACCVSSILRQKQHTLGKHADGAINNVIRIMHAAVHQRPAHSNNRCGGTHCSHSAVVVIERANSSQKYYDAMVYAPGTRSMTHVSIEHACCVSSILRQKQHTLGKHADGVINNVIRIMHAAVHWRSMHSDNSSLEYDYVMV